MTSSVQICVICGFPVFVRNPSSPQTGVIGMGIHRSDCVGFPAELRNLLQKLSLKPELLHGGGMSTGMHWLCGRTFFSSASSSQFRCSSSRCLFQARWRRSEDVPPSPPLQPHPLLANPPPRQAPVRDPLTSQPRFVCSVIKSLAP